jgi:hypothetical protein
MFVLEKKFFFQSLWHETGGDIEFSLQNNNNNFRPKTLDLFPSPAAAEWHSE